MTLNLISDMQWVNKLSDGNYFQSIIENDRNWIKKFKKSIKPQTNNMIK